MNTKNNTNAQPAGQSPELRSTDWFGDRVTSILTALDETQRAHAYVQANIYQWPDALVELKPSEWETLDQRAKYEQPAAQSVWRVLMEVTTPFSRSKQWWLENLGRTEAEHMAWWRAQRHTPNTV